MANATSNAKNADTGIDPMIAKCANELMDKAEAAGAACMDKAKDVASSVSASVSDAGSAIGGKANEATAAVGSGMKSLAGAIREHTPGDGALHTASASVAESLESGGRYLQEEGLNGMATDIINLVRRNPIPALLVGVGIGFVLAKVTTSGLKNGN